jgi:hypothetical protein
VRREEDRGASLAPTALISDPVAHVSFSLDPDGRVALKGEAVIFNLKTPARVPGDDAAVFYYKAPADPGDVERKRMIEQKLTEQQLANAGETREKMTRRAPSWESEDGQRWEENVEQLPARDVEGVRAEGTRITRTIPAGAIGNERPIAMVTEEWRSADLQVLVSTTTSDPRTGESSYRLMNVVRGEPAAGLFEVPAGYTVKDSEIRQNIVIKREPK